MDQDMGQWRGHCCYIITVYLQVLEMSSYSLSSLTVHLWYFSLT